tara:strand:+ start:3119 stop:3493 length:375 start_codon:yes stop_codon:yes gene_type:complete
MPEYKKRYFNELSKDREVIDESIIGTRVLLRLIDKHVLPIAEPNKREYVKNLMEDLQTRLSVYTGDEEDTYSLHKTNIVDIYINELRNELEFVEFIKEFQDKESGVVKKDFPTDAELNSPSFKV